MADHLDLLRRLKVWHDASGKWPSAPVLTELLETLKRVEAEVQAEQARTHAKTRNACQALGRGFDVVT